MSKVVRSVKNVTKGYTTAQVKVRNATSNDAWGPVGSDMAEIAQMTYDIATFYEIMDIIDKRLNDKGKNWRHVLKSLKVLDYCLHEGSEHVVTWSRKNIYIIKTLREFQHIDEDGKDVGQNIRVSAKELTSLILDEERLRAERQDRKNWKSRVTGLDDVGQTSHNGEPHRKPPRKERPNEDEDLEYRLAIEASKNEAEEDARRRAKAVKETDEDADLAKAIKLSKEEEDLRRKELEEANATSLFDDTPTPTQPAVTQPTGWNQGYQQQPTVDWFGNVIDPHQQQNTGFGLQGQPTSYQNGFGYSGLQQQTQPTGYGNPSFQNFQGTGFGTSTPYSQQPNGFGTFGQQQQQQQQPQPQPQPQQQQQQQQPDNLQPGSHNPFAGTQQLAQDAKPQPSGSNNPFATSFQRPASAQPRIQPTLSTLQEQKAATSFNPITNYQVPQPQLQLQPLPIQQQQQQQQPIKPQDPHMARLNALLASGDGQDTFGNVGDLRIPAQHTAPGTFVNSAGSGLGRITQNATGNNPFLNSQFTGMPQQTGFGQNRVMPAQTGPAGSFGNVAPFGAGGNNPFGAIGGNQQQQGQGGSLIDL